MHIREAMDIVGGVSAPKPIIKVKGQEVFFNGQLVGTIEGWRNMTKQGLSKSSGFYLKLTTGEELFRKEATSKDPWRAGCYAYARDLVKDLPNHAQEILSKIAPDKSGLPKLLLIVHPGSACGSADFNIGDDDAKTGRAAIAADCASWRGAVLVLDGDLSPELKARRYSGYGAAIAQTVARAKQAGLPAARIVACTMETPNWELVALAAVQKMVGPESEVAITGAWHHTADSEGCCDAMRDALVAAGMQASLLPSALTLDAGDDDQRYEDD